MEQHTIYRVEKIIKRIINDLEIKLADYTVLTEAGSNHYLFTPIIAALAGSPKVFIWARDSHFGKASDIQKDFSKITEQLQIQNTEFIWALNDRPAEHIRQADIITNLGAIRPLDRNFLTNINVSKTVVPLMCEAWELRDTDIDLDFCKKNNIRVSGTWENHPGLRIFDSCGPLAIKMANEAGYEVFQNNIIVWSDDHFGDVIESAFKNHGAGNVIKTIDPKILLENSETADFIFVCDYDEKRTIAGENGIFDLSLIKKKNNGIGIVHLYGAIDNSYVKNRGLNVYPDRRGKAMNMTFTLAHIGPVPMINLHAAGLKVGELMKKNEKSNLVQNIV